MRPRSNTELIDLRREGFAQEEEGGRWATYCRRHQSFIQHETRALARDWKPYPEEWCEGCMREANPEAYEDEIEESWWRGR